MTSRGVFFGWYVALAFSVMAFVSTGIRFAIGPFLKPMVADLDLDRGSFSLVIALGLLIYGVFQPFVGTLIDRLGSRTLVVAGAILMGASLVATGYVTKLWHLYLWSSPRWGWRRPVRSWARPCSRRGSRGGAPPRWRCSARRRWPA